MIKQVSCSSESNKLANVSVDALATSFDALHLEDCATRLGFVEKLTRFKVDQHPLRNYVITKDPHDIGGISYLPPLMSSDRVVLLTLMSSM